MSVAAQIFAECAADSVLREGDAVNESVFAYAECECLLY